MNRHEKIAERLTQGFDGELSAALMERLGIIDHHDLYELVREHLVMHLYFVGTCTDNHLVSDQKLDPSEPMP